VCKGTRYPGKVLKRVAVAGLAALFWACRGAEGEPSTEAIDPYSAPTQEPATPVDVEAAHYWAFGDITFEAKASYRIAARVLSSERYYMGWTGEVVPIDLALGWGELSDPAIDELIDWYQGGRWYFWTWSERSLLDNREVAASSANVHVVPATPNLARALFALDEDDIVQLRGFLVNINGPDGARWRSSLARDDTGGGSCELLYVQELIADEVVYR